MIRAPVDDLAPTRHSLLARLKNWQDQQSWQEFFDTYWRLIYWTALKAGLSPEQAQDIVQETMVVVARNIHKFKPGRENGSFRGWLRNVTRWRLADHFQRRHKSPGAVPDEAGVDLEQIPDPTGTDLEMVWESEWERNLLLVAADRVKARVKAEHYQAFDLCAAKGWPARKVAQYLNMSVPAVYVAKHRIQAQLRAEVRRLRRRHQ
ncbi:MAG TPA: sigma-70 family RNA polymerase sigma factor [Candidatus Paceibacterota bacterium]|nr:sigma-70 family RNA polymerase sigma factor [Candidatus Paceibacterota bacterium]